MRKEGTIVRWDDAKGFGFIRTGAVAQDIFVHVRDYSGAGEAPRQGMRVTFEDIHAGGKGPRAVAVQPVAGVAAKRPHGETARTAPSPGRRAGRAALHTSRSNALGMLPLMIAYGVGLTWLVLQRLVPWWVLPASVLLNLATFFAYWLDKDAAQNGRWRIKEGTLHLWSLAGGWAGAWLAQRLLRHKSVKASFRVAYWFTVAAHCSALVGTWWVLRRAH